MTLCQFLLYSKVTQSCTHTHTHTHTHSHCFSTSVPQRKVTGLHSTVTDLWCLTSTGLHITVPKQFLMSSISSSVSGPLQLLTLAFAWLQLLIKSHRGQGGCKETVPLQTSFLEVFCTWGLVSLASLSTLAN